MDSSRFLLLLGIVAVDLTLAGAAPRAFSAEASLTKDRFEARRRRRSVLLPFGQAEDGLVAEAEDPSLLELSSAEHLDRRSGAGHGKQLKAEAASLPIWAIIMVVVLILASAVQVFRKFFVCDELVADLQVLAELKADSNDTRIIAKIKDMDAKANTYIIRDMCIRAAVFSTLAASTRIMPDLFNWMQYMAFDPRAIVAFLVFNLNPSFGATLIGVTNGMIGTGLAAFFIWFATHQYPNGYHTGDPQVIWYFGAGWLVFTVTFILGARFPDGVKIWCLTTHVGNMMAFMTGAATIPTLVPSVIGSMMLMGLGGFMALVGTLLPNPYMESRNALTGMYKTTTLFSILLNGVVEAYTGEGDTEYDQGGAINSQLRAAINTLGGNVNSAWYEHVDWSATTRNYIQMHKDVMQKLLFHVSCIQKAMEAGWEPQTVDKEKIQDAGAKISKLLDDCVEVIEGNRKRNTLKTDDVMAAMEAIPDVTTNHAAGSVIYLLRSLAVTATDYASAIQNLDSRDVPVTYVYWSIISYWANAVGFDLSLNLGDQKVHWAALKAHMNGAMRLIISVLVCFSIGYVGYGDVITKFDASIAVNAAFLLGSTPGSALQGNLKKFQGIVLGTAGGQLMVPLIADLAGFGPLVLALVLFVFILITSLIKFSSPDFALTGMLLGVFGSQQMLAPPGAANCDQACMDATLAGAYKSIISAVMSILVMTVVDIVLANPALGKEDPQTTTIKAWRSFVDGAQSACMTVLGEQRESRDVDVAKEVNRLLAKGAKAELLKYIEDMSGKLASMDLNATIAAGIHGGAFNLAMYQGLSGVGHELLDDLWILASVVCDKNAKGGMKDDLAKAFKSLSTPRDMFEEVVDFLEGSSAKFAKPGIMSAPDAWEAFDIVMDGKEKLDTAAEPSDVQEPVLGYATANILQFKKKVWSAASATA
jgi:hypothetical protein